MPKKNQLMLTDHHTPRNAKDIPRKYLSMITCIGNKFYFFLFDQPPYVHGPLSDSG